MGSLLELQYQDGVKISFLAPMHFAEGGLSGLCFSALGAVVEKALRAPPLHNFWALRPMAEGALPEREAPDILSECHPLAAALTIQTCALNKIHTQCTNELRNGSV